MATLATRVPVVAFQRLARFVVPAGALIRSWVRVPGEVAVNFMPSAQLATPPLVGRASTPVGFSMPPEVTNPSDGHTAAVPVHLSATSQTPADGRQMGRVPELVANVTSTA
jgi:hypothetical protein